MADQTARPTLLDPVRYGSIEAPNRVVMAPLTRSRAAAGRVPHALQAEYYAQRAGAGLIVSEATVVSDRAAGYVRTPGIFTPEQVAGWRLTTDAVHREGGRIVSQLWHVGRVSHAEFQPDGDAPLSSSPGTSPNKVFTGSGFDEATPARALETHEIPLVVNQYGAATANARAAGFDGVEVHGANGYLIEQFLASDVNVRDDRYGGDREGRSRFLFEVLDAVIANWGDSGRVGLRLSLGNGSSGCTDDDPCGFLTWLGERLSRYQLAYVHLVTDWSIAGSPDPEQDTLEALRKGYDGMLITNGGYELDSAAKELADERADAVAFGKLFISNPDLVERFRRGAQLAEWDEDTFYTAGSQGYTDYPALDDAA